MLIARLEAAGIAKPPRWLANNVLYLTTMGSMAYGCNEDDSDMDVYGFCVPPKDEVWPHLRGEIPGFGRQLKRFEQYQEVHLHDPSARGGKGQSYDVSCYSIVKYFQLCMENNPNMIDSLFTSRECVIHSTRVAELVRERRRIFLHKGSWHKFRGYAYSQLAKMSSKTPEAGSKRAALRDRFGFDVKFAMHLVRLIGEVEQILTTGDIDLRRDCEMLRDIRRGNWTEAQVREWFHKREKELEPLYTTSTAVPYGPDEEAIKALLLQCLEDHYGSLGNCVVSESRAVAALRDIRAIIDRV
jgi:predicted nucleotidyltransferase